RGGGDEDGQQQPPRSDPPMAWASWDGFPCVVAALPSPVRGLAAVTVEAARGGGLGTARCRAHPGPPGGMQAWPGPAVGPWAAIPVDTGPRRIRLGTHAPCEAPGDARDHGLDHRPESAFAVASPRLGGWDHLCNKSPCGLRKV